MIDGAKIRHILVICKLREIYRFIMPKIKNFRYIENKIAFLSVILCKFVLKLLIFYL